MRIIKQIAVPGIFAIVLVAAVVLGIHRASIHSAALVEPPASRYVPASDAEALARLQRLIPLRRDFEDAEYFYKRARARKTSIEDAFEYALDIGTEAPPKRAKKP